MVQYTDLKPEEKLEVLEEWIIYCIGIGHYRVSIERYFDLYCTQFKRGSKRFALRQAKYCFYCESDFSVSRKTIDHFYAKGHRRRRKNGINPRIVCCEKCNGWKGQQKPETILKYLEKRELPKIGKFAPEWGEQTAARISRILRDGRYCDEYYYLDREILKPL